MLMGRLREVKRNRMTEVRPDIEFHPQRLKKTAQLRFFTIQAPRLTRSGQQKPQKIFFHDSCLLKYRTKITITIDTAKCLFSHHFRVK